jgi:tetratricopeptide (TPR) repeat protein
MVKQKEDPSKISTTAQKLLDTGDLDLAAAYFWFAAEKFANVKEYGHAAHDYEKAGYCYDIEGRWEKASEEHHKAEKMYMKMGQLVQAALIRGQIKSVEKKLSDISILLRKYSSIRTDANKPLKN